MPLRYQAFEDGSRPIREHELLDQREREAGRPRLKKLAGTGVVLTPEGAVRDYEILTYQHCGHVISDGIGGKCTVPGCTNVSCKACYAASRCQICFAGCCLEHKHEVDCNGVVRVVCEQCKERLQRQARRRALARFFLSPFIEFNDR